jgi:hypothetical protein
MGKPRRGWPAFRKSTPPPIRIRFINEMSRSRHRREKVTLLIVLRSETFDMGRREQWPTGSKLFSSRRRLRLHFLSATVPAFNFSAGEEVVK